jgi:hypothetical protein
MQQNATPMAHEVFISHSARNKSTADAVCAILESGGIRCWIAPRDVTPGREWGECIVEAIRQTRVMVLIFTSDANASPQIRREVERAVNHGIVILPFRIEDVAPAPALEYFIGNVHWLDALTPPLESHLRNLATTIQTLLNKPVPDPPKPQPPVVTDKRKRGSWIWSAVVTLLAAVIVFLIVQRPRPAADLPSLSPAAGTYPAPQPVVIADSSPGATIYYTLDGSPPTRRSTVYTQPLTGLRSGAVVRAMAVAPGFERSSDITGVYLWAPESAQSSPPASRRGSQSRPATPAPTNDSAPPTGAASATLSLKNPSPQSAGRPAAFTGAGHQPSSASDEPLCPSGALFSCSGLQHHNALVCADAKLASTLPPALPLAADDQEGGRCFLDKERETQNAICSGNMYLCGYAAGMGGASFVLNGKAWGQNEVHTGSHAYFTNLSDRPTKAELVDAIRSWLQSLPSEPRGPRSLIAQWKRGFNDGQKARYLAQRPQ